MIPATSPLHAERLVPQKEFSLLPDRKAIVKQLALHTLAELAISLTIGLAVATFTGTLATIVVFGAAIIQTIVSLAVRSLGIYCAQKALQGSDKKEFYLKVAQITSYIAPWSFTWMSSINGHTLVHEAGHALAVKAVYQNPQVKIQIIPFLGGFTSFPGEAALTKFGAKLGESKAIAFITAAGPGLSLLASSILFSTSFFLKEKCPKLSRYMSVSAVTDFWTHTAYALSALTASPQMLSHDFVRLRTFGLHPIAAAAGIVALPILIGLASSALSAKIHPPQPALAAAL